MATEPQSETALNTFAAVVALVAERREGTLLAHLENYLHLVLFEPGRIEFRPTEGAPRDLAKRLSQFLNAETDMRWMVTVSQEHGVPTIQETRNVASKQALDDVAKHPLVQAVMENFPEAKIEKIHTRDIADEPTDENTDENNVTS